MTRIISLVGFTFFAVSQCLVAADGTASRPLSPAVPPELALEFAKQLQLTVDLLSEQYVRPVSRSELILTALQALYDAAQVPRPTELEREIRLAEGNANKLRSLIIHHRERVRHPESLHDHKALQRCLQTTLEKLDPYCTLVSPTERAKQMYGEYGGIGVECEPNPTGVGLLLKTVYLGGPAQQAGLRPGDVITRVNSATVTAKDLDYVRLLFGPPEAIISGNKAIKLETRRTGEAAPRKVSLSSAASFQVEHIFGVQRKDDHHWTFWRDKSQGIAHVRFGMLYTGTAAELEQLLTQLKMSGLRGLLLDLRWCPGGYLDEAVDIASLFVGNQTICTLENRKAGSENKSRISVRSTFDDFPLIVLVNQETVGGGELVAAAIQDMQRGYIMGQRTRGKGSVQTLLRLDEERIHMPISGTTVRFSQGLFIRANGKNLHRFTSSKENEDWGVRPNKGYEFAISSALTKKLHDWWQLHNYRPGGDKTILPLDDSSNDPHCEAALLKLQELIQKK